MKTRISNKSRSLFQILIPVLGIIAVIFGWYLDHILFDNAETHIPIWLIAFVIFAILYIFLLGLMAEQLSLIRRKQSQSDD